MNGLLKRIKPLKLLVGLLLLAALVYILPLLLSKGAEKNFYRLEPLHMTLDTARFRVDKSLRRIYFKNGKSETELKDIPSINGLYFYLKGKKQIKLTPPLTGDTGFYTYLYMESLTKGVPINFRFELYRQGRKRGRELGRVRGANVSRPFYKGLSVAKGDRLLLRFEGRGIVYLSRPVIYRRHVPTAPERGKHIFFIAVDTFRGDLIGKKVDGQSLTPNMERFTRDSVYLERTYAQTSWTLPSYMSLFTGLYEFNHEVGIKNPLPPGKPFLVEPLSRDFITFGFHGGKVVNARWGYSRGFDYYKKFQPAGALYPKGGQSLFGKAVEVLKQGRFPNLFLFLHTYQVHAPYTPPPEFLERLDKNPKYRKLEAVNFNEPAKTYDPVADDYRQALERLYRAEALAFDAYFGEFTDKLKAMNLYDNAMIVLMSDHGEEFFEHKGWGHSHGLYDELIRVPAIIKFPGNRFKNTRITHPVGVLDLMPTILSFYDIPYETKELDGQDLMPLIRASGSEGKIAGKVPGIKRRYVVSSISTGRYFEALPTRIALVFDHYKLIYNDSFGSKGLEFFDGHTAPPQPPRFELYDLNKDPGEINNIAAAFPRVKEKMMPLLLRIQKIIRQRIAAQGKKEKPLDKEVEEQLKSLGYL
ncbi:MAG: sulfatase-like hydrolase/transferase [bacterium]|nr:sulfatase-like hydrolase/transferase [bacterium]